MQDRTPTPTAAPLNLHLKAGSRLAMRTGVPAAAVLTAGIGLSPDPSATLRLVANDLASGSGSFTVGVLLAIVAGGMATWAAPRICHGVNGWVRHLPADWPAHRRALLGALTAAELPVAITWCALWLVAWSLGSDVEPRRLLAMSVVLVGVSLTRVPARWSIVVASAGVVTVGLALFAGWPGLAPRRGGRSRCGTPHRPTAWSHPARRSLAFQRCGGSDPGTDRIPGDRWSPAQRLRADPHSFRDGVALHAKQPRVVPCGPSATRRGLHGGPGHCGPRAAARPRVVHRGAGRDPCRGVQRTGSGTTPCGWPRTPP